MKVRAQGPWWGASPSRLLGYVMGGWVGAETPHPPYCWGWHPRNSTDVRRVSLPPLPLRARGRCGHTGCWVRGKTPKSSESGGSVGACSPDGVTNASPCLNPWDAQEPPPHHCSPLPPPQPTCFSRAQARGARSHGNTCRPPLAPAKPNSPHSLCWRRGVIPEPAQGGTPNPLPSGIQPTPRPLPRGSAGSELLLGPGCPTGHFAVSFQYLVPGRICSPIAPSPGGWGTGDFCRD